MCGGPSRRAAINPISLCGANRARRSLLPNRDLPTPQPTSEYWWLRGTRSRCRLSRSTGSGQRNCPRRNASPSRASASCVSASGRQVAAARVMHMRSDRLARRLPVDAPQRDVDAAEGVDGRSLLPVSRSSRGRACARAGRSLASSLPTANGAARCKWRARQGLDDGFDHGRQRVDSPKPVMPASVSKRISSTSWLPSALATSTPGWRSMIACISVTCNQVSLRQAY